MPCGLGASGYHYYILHQDSITIINKIKQQIVLYCDLKHIGIVQGMVYDNTNQIFWIYSETEI